ncbi:uncharacterized protein BDZ99DRAFT_483852 [Mytilinidion resinicola]|uniref:Inosine/uridine-preferring nucleoside hydrolase domain-containing protein n=1 Tax=Mytilinidion resinicola TaxID=574789 RepID=A0A6A6Y0E2_9PEZI|nr:uncharacterized protein BDZ99DRAFT_483852 [Mytilinidion resinicola]KAF2801277.1 hypothetical protein BDZ99DRAFT_483852 [Mytilinidion resinicola]
MLYRLLRTIAIGSTLLLASVTGGAHHETTQLIIDADIFSVVDDTAALFLASTLPNVNLLAVNVHTQSSALAVSAIAGHHGHTGVPVGLLRPITNDSFFDDWLYERREYASKVAYHYSNGSLPWGNATDAWDPVALYRKTLAAQKDGSVTIASVGFFDNLSGLLNSTADAYSRLPGPALIAAKVSKLVIMV